MTQKIEQSQRQERVAAWNRRAECDLAAFQNSPKQTYQAEKARDRKLCANLEEAIRRSGLQDGMTVSFHHAFRGGDLTVNMVMDVIAKMGFKNLTLASSSLSDCHAPLVEHIRQGVVTRIYTSGLRGPLAEEISRGLLAEPVQIHSHGGRVHLVQSGELNIDVAFLGVPSCDEFGNANGYTGKACCGSLGYAMVDADNAKQVVMLTEELLPYPHNPASIEQDQVDLIVKVDRVGDAAKIGAGATRMTTNPRELLIARSAADVIVNSGYFKEGFSMQTGTGGASLAVTRFLEDKMRSRDIRADFALGGITATMVDLHVVPWKDITRYNSAWNTLVNLATLVVMANGLTRSGFIDWFAGTMSTHLEGFSPNATVIVLVLVFYFAHYLFASLSAHTATMLPVILAVGKGIPGVPMEQLCILLVLSIGIMGCLTPYATGPGVIIYGCGYVKSKDYWRLGAIFGVIYISMLLLVGWPILAMWN